MKDKFHDIDQFIRLAQEGVDVPFVGNEDWLIVEQKLKQRRNHFYAFWFFLVLILSSSIVYVLNHQNLAPSDVTNKGQIAHKNGSKQETVDERSLNGMIGDVLSSQTNEQVKTEDIKFEQFASSLSQNALTEQRPETIFLGYMNYLKPTLYIYSDDRFISSVPYLINPKDNLGGIEDSDKSNLSFEIGVHTSPYFVNKFIEDNRALAGLINKYYKNNVLSGENIALVTSTGVSTQFNFNKWFVLSGVSLSKVRESLNYNYSIDHDVDVNLTTKNIDGYILRPLYRREKIEYKGTNTYDYLEIPLNIGIKTYISPRFELRNQMGATMTILQNKSGRLADYTTLALNDLSADNRFANSSIRATYKTGIFYKLNGFNIGVEPLVSYNITSITDVDNSAILVKPLNYGVSVGVSYIFRKEDSNR